MSIYISRIELFSYKILELPFVEKFAFGLYSIVLFIKNIRVY